MRSDILQKRKTEVDYINGYVVAVANKMAFLVPENEKLLQQIKALEIMKWSVNSKYKKTLKLLFKGFNFSLCVALTWKLKGDKLLH